jgi:malate dehydrogenase (oxaloacetate-decarboxylating)
MNPKPIIFALANPAPEIFPEEAAEGGAFIYASGRSDFTNQINNSLVFPGIFKGIIRHEMDEITDDMKLLAAEAIAKSLTKKATTEYIIPDSLDRDVTLRIVQEMGRVKK